jgi:hypothetical protein
MNEEAMSRVGPQRRKKSCFELTSTERGSSKEGLNLQWTVVLVIYFAQKIKER